MNGKVKWFDPKRDTDLLLQRMAVRYLYTIQVS